MQMHVILKYFKFRLTEKHRVSITKTNLSMLFREKSLLILRILWNKKYTLSAKCRALQWWAGDIYSKLTANVHDALTGKAKVTVHPRTEHKDPEWE